MFFCFRTDHSVCPSQYNIEIFSICTLSSAFLMLYFHIILSSRIMNSTSHTNSLTYLFSSRLIHLVGGFLHICRGIPVNFLHNILKWDFMRGLLRMSAKKRFISFPQGALRGTSTLAY